MAVWAQPWWSSAAHKSAAAYKAFYPHFKIFFKSCEKTSVPFFQHSRSQLEHLCAEVHPCVLQVCLSLRLQGSSSQAGKALKTALRNNQHGVVGSALVLPWKGVSSAVILLHNKKLVLAQVRWTRLRCCRAEWASGQNKQSDDDELAVTDSCPGGSSPATKHGGGSGRPTSGPFTVLSRETVKCNAHVVHD